MLTLLVGVAGGVVAALRQNTVVDQAAMVAAMLGISMPSFFFAPLMVLLFAVHLGWLPSGGYVPFTDDPLGLAARRHPAGGVAGAAAGGAAGADHPVHHAGGAAAGLRAHGPGEGAVRLERGGQARTGQRA